MPPTSRCSTSRDSARIDDPATANTGAGTRTYDDRGAYEFAPPPNRAPVADAQSVTTAEDTAAPITLTGSDPDGDSLAYEVVDAPAHGTLTGTAPALTYTPDADYDGPDSFTFTVSDGSLTSAPATVSITVTPVPDAPVITWPAPDPITYGAALDATQLNATADVDGTFAYSPDLGTVLHSGPAQVLAVTFTPTDTVHYATATAEVTIDVNPAPLTITADSQAKTYLDPLPDLTWTPGSFTNGDTAAVLSGSPACTTTATAASPVGAYPITCATGTLAAADYTFSFVDGSLTIGKADQAITFGPLDPKTVGDPPFVVSATTTSPLAVSFAATGACTVLADEVTLTGAGSCTITASQAGDDNWNAATPVDQTFSIGKLDQAALAVTAPTAGTYGTFYDLAFSGGSGTGALTWEVVEGSTACAIASGGPHDGQLQITAGTGDCTVRVTRAADATYNAASATGTVLVGKADQAIDFDAAPTGVVVAGTASVHATASSTLAVAYSSMTTDVCTVDPATGALTLLAVGTCTIAGDQAGDSNWNAAPQVTQDVAVGAATFTLTYTAGLHGTITGTSPQTVESGADGTPVTAVADAGYHFVAWSDGVLTASRTDLAVTGDVTVSASFAIDGPALSGAVTVLATGLPVSGATVSAWNAGSGAWVAAGVTNGSGLYTHHPAGRQLQAVRPAGQRPGRLVRGREQGDRHDRRGGRQHHPGHRARQPGPLGRGDRARDRAAGLGRHGVRLERGQRGLGRRRRHQRLRAVHASPCRPAATSCTSSRPAARPSGSGARARRPPRPSWWPATPPRTSRSATRPSRAR